MFAHVSSFREGAGNRESAPTDILGNEHAGCLDMERVVRRFSRASGPTQLRELQYAGALRIGLDRERSRAVIKAVTRFQKAAWNTVLILLFSATMSSMITGYAGPVDSVTTENGNLRRVLFTGPHMQFVVMSLNPGEDMGKERHPSLDQFFRVEQGEGVMVFNETEHRVLHDGDAILVPAGTWHNVINMSSSVPLKLYTLYAPPKHADKAGRRTKADTEAAESLARLAAL